MKKGLRLLTFCMVLVLVLSLAQTGAAARPTVPVKLAPIYGRYDFSSDEVVTVIAELEAVFPAGGQTYRAHAKRG